MNPISSGFIKAIYLSLAHSLWQGLLLAILAAIIIGATRKAAPAMRYNLLLIAFLLFITGNVCTLIYQLENIAGYRVTVTVIQGEDMPWGLRLQHYADQLMDGLYVGSLLRWLNAHTALVVVLWFVIVCLRIVQMSLGLSGMRHLRRSAADTVPEQWKVYIQQKAAAMGIRRAVQLAASAGSKTPMVLGYFKPLILVPAGLLAQVAPADLEAILAHELAHIRRRDYVVNLLQHLAETIFFFNPAVWWVSAQLRSEREHCCDDAAIEVTGSKRQYLQALVTCEEYARTTTPYILSFAGQRHQLRDRVLRLISGYSPAGSRIEKAILSGCLCTLLLGTLALYSYTIKPLSATLDVHTSTASVARTPEIPAETVCPPRPVSVAEPDAAAQPVPPVLPAVPVLPVAPVAAVAPVVRDTNPVEALVVEMELDGLVAVNAPNLQVHISNHTVAINGVTVSAEVSQKYRDRYVALSGSRGDWQVRYERETNN